MLFIVITFFVGAVLALFNSAAGLAFASQSYLFKSAIFEDAGTGGDVDSLLLGIVLPAIVFFVTGLKSLKEEKSMAPHLIDFLLVALGCILFVGSLYAPEPTLGFEIGARYFLLGLSFYLFGRLVGAKTENSARDLKAFVTVTWLVAIVMGSVALVQNASSDFTRLTIGEANPIPFGLLIGSGLLINVYWLIIHRDTPPFVKIVQFGTGLFLGATLIAANSRGPIIAFVLAAIFILMVSSFGGRALMSISAIAKFVGVVFISVLGISYFNPEVATRTQDGFLLLISENQGESVVGRLAAQTKAIDLFSQHPVFGVGTGGFSSFHYLPYPHNIFLEVASEQGMIGLVILLSLVVAGATLCLRVGQLKQKEPHVVIIAALMVFFFIEAQFSFTIWMHKNLYLVLGILVSRVTCLSRTKAEASAHSHPIKVGI